MYLTVEEYRALGVCSADVEIFTRLFGNQMPVNRASLTLAWENYLTLYPWAVKTFGEVYREAEVAATKAYYCTVDATMDFELELGQFSPRYESVREAAAKVYQESLIETILSQVTSTP